MSINGPKIEITPPGVSDSVLRLFASVPNMDATVIEQATRIISCFSTPHLANLAAWCLLEQRQLNANPAAACHVPASVVRMLGAEISRRLSADDPMSTVLPVVLPARAASMAHGQLQSMKEVFERELDRLKSRVRKHNQASEAFKIRWVEAQPNPSAALRAEEQRLTERMEHYLRAHSSLQQGLAIIHEALGEP
jgi:hypothetical protein